MWTHAREGTVVPEVALVREAVADKTQLALLGILFNGVEELFLGDLQRRSRIQLVNWPPAAHNISAYLLLSVGPTRNLNNHVQNSLLLVGVQRNIVEGRDGHAILLDVHTVLESVGGTDFADGIRHGGVDGIRGQCGRGSRNMPC